MSVKNIILNIIGKLYKEKLEVELDKLIEKRTESFERTLLKLENQLKELNETNLELQKNSTILSEEEVLVVQRIERCKSCKSMTVISTGTGFNYCGFCKKPYTENVYIVIKRPKVKIIK